MTTGIVQEQNLEKQIEKQMGCMAGFLQIFDRHQMLTGKRIYSTKRLPPAPAVGSEYESEQSIESSAKSRELEKPQQIPRQQQGRSIPSREGFKHSPGSELRYPAPEPGTLVGCQTKLTLPLPVFELREGTRSSWKFSKEAPRLSLDSRAVVDAKGSLKPREICTNASILSSNRCESTEESAADDIEKQRRSTSVIARLMGLEPLPNSDPEAAKKSELRRSASESRVSKDFHQYRFIDGINFQLKQTQPVNSRTNITTSNAVIRQNNAAREERTINLRQVDPNKFTVRNVRGEPAKAPHRGIGQRKSFFDSADFFPEPKQNVSIYGEIEKRLRMRGIDETSKDLETLKQILEAWQLKGLLHPKKSSTQANLRNFVYDQSQIVVVKPASVDRLTRAANDLSPSSFRSSTAPRRNLNFSSEMSPAISPRRERPEFERNVRSQSQSRGRNAVSPTRYDTGVKSPSRRRPLNVETQRKASNESTEQRRGSPKINGRRTVGDQIQTTNRSPRMTKQTAKISNKEEKVFNAAEDEVCTISECSFSTSSQTDTEKSKVEQNKEGRSLLERCDKLLHSIAEITASGSATELQPSPVSVLDSSFYKEESSPSPVMKRSIDFKEQQMEWEDDVWSHGMSNVELKTEDDCDFIYISDILRASNYLPEESDVFSLLEKQQYLKGKDTSKVSKLQRKLIFDTINEIVSRKRQLPPWKVITCTNFNSLQQIWSEFEKVRERDSSDDLFNVICGVVRKDLAGDAINGDCPIEMSEAVLDIERLIFKDLIVETIRGLAFSRKCNPVPALRRKLIF